MQRNTRTETNGLRLAALSAFACFAAVSFVLAPQQIGSAAAGALPVPTPARAAKPPKYSEFPHSQKAHQMACSNCHKFPSDNWNKVRQGDAAFPDITDYPKHESCLNCHRQQFFRGRPPVICSICHTNPSPNNSSRHPFPNPRELFDASPKGKTAVSDFAISFPHGKHVDIVSQRSNGETRFTNASWPARTAAEESCSVCHKTYQPQGDADDEFVVPPPAKWGDKFWLKKGTFKTVPIGHTTCFTCHSADTGLSPAPTDCATCHKLKPPDVKNDFDPTLAAAMKLNDKIVADEWRRRDSSGTFRHEWFSHAELSCATCHNVSKINTLDVATKKVPVSACGTCHATATSDDGGALNFEIDERRKNAKFECSKCHLNFGKLPIPDSHLKAVAAATGK
jgi:hypothetical protein